MKSWIFIAIAVVIWLWSLHIKVQFKPFSVSFVNWREALGIILVVIGVHFMKEDYGREKYSKGFDVGADFVLQRIKSMVDRTNNSQPQTPQ